MPAVEDNALGGHASVVTVAFFLPELPSLLPIVDVAEALLHVRNGAWFLCLLVANVPDSFNEGKYNLKTKYWNIGELWFDLFSFLFYFIFLKTVFLALYSGLSLKL